LAAASPRPLAAQAAQPPRLVVRGLHFVGNHALDDYTLAMSIATTNSGYLARAGWIRWLGLGEKKYFDETEFRRDVLRVILLYRISGYLQVQVDTLVQRSPGAVDITFRITEGPPVRVRSIAITGTEGIVPARDLLRDIPLAVGDPFNRIKFGWASDTIQAAVRDLGYPFAEVFRSYDVNEDSLSARIGFDVQPGTRARVDSVIVEGTKAVAPAVVRRMISIHRGDWYSQRALYQSQRDLYSLGVFGYVNVGLADSTPRSQDSSVAIRVQVAEAKLHRLRAGAGYGSVDCFRALTSWSASNVLGGGRELDLTAQVSKLGVGAPLSAGLQNSLCSALQDEPPERLKVNYNLSASLQEPFLFSRRMRGSVSLSAEQHSEIQAYLRRAVTANVAVTRQTRWNIPVTLSYAISEGFTIAEPATFCAYLNVCDSIDVARFQQRQTEAVLGISLVRDRSNSVVDPTRGSRVSVEARYAAGFLGSDSLNQFARGSADITSYYQLGRRAVFAWRIEGGAIVSPQLGFAGQSVRFVPPSERFYAGGPNSVRGYGQNQMGPVVRVVDADRVDTVITVNAADPTRRDTVLSADTLLAATGGNSLLVGNAELRFPLPGFSGRLSGALFVDVGQLIERGSQLFEFSTIRVTPGVGIRIATPLGPLRFDVAYNGYAPQQGPLYLKQGQQLVKVTDTYPSPNEPHPHLQFHFAIGQAF
jgi:outer membrane protein insertion porin family